MSRLQTPPRSSSSQSPASSASPAPSAASASSAAAGHRLSSWQLAAVCLFWELFSHLLPSSPHFHPEVHHCLHSTAELSVVQYFISCVPPCSCCYCAAQSLLAGLHCREHQATTVQSSRFSKKARPQVEEKADERSDDVSRSSSPSVSPSPLAHDASGCRCYGVDCLHLVHLHVSLLSAAGYNAATAESWLQHFNMELDARREDWPAIEDAIRQDEEEEAEEDGAETAEEEKKAANSAAPSASAFFSMKKRKRPAHFSRFDNGDHHPLWSAHYHALSPAVKCLLLYLHTSWMLQDNAVRDFISEDALRSSQAYGTDDAGRRYHLFSQQQQAAALLAVRQQVQAALLTAVRRSALPYQCILCGRRIASICTERLRAPHPRSASGSWSATLLRSVHCNCTRSASHWLVCCVLCAARQQSARAGGGCCSADGAVVSQQSAVGAAHQR
jgi:hypothetical protein